MAATMSAPQPDAKFARLISLALSEQLGADARWRLYDRSLNTPMNFVLEAAGQHLEETFVVVWVDGGYPEIFTLIGLPFPVVVYSTRYLELTSAVRSLFVHEHLSSHRSEIAERVALKIISELSLRRGDPDAAVRCLLGSLVGKGIFIPDSDVLPDMEQWPIGEAYMSMWFFGLLHELGHSTSLADDELGPLSAKGIDQGVRVTLESFDLPAELDIDDLLAQLRDARDHPLASTHLRAEAIADLFAASVLLQTTIDFMRKVDAGEFDPLQAIAEIAIYLNIVAFIARCTSVAELISTGLTRPVLKDQLVRPAAFYVRAALVRYYLSITFAAYYSGGGEPDAERIARWQRIVDDASNVLEPAIRDMDSSWGRAFRFALAGGKPSTSALLEQLRNELSTRRGALTRIEVEQFCALADSRGASSPWLERLRSVLHPKPQASHEGESEADASLFLVPYIADRDGTAQVAYTMQTRHGQLLLAFVSQEQEFHPFTRFATETLKPEYTIRTMGLIAPDVEEVARLLDEDDLLPSTPTRIVLEGTPFFDQVIQELEDDTIWPPG